MNLVTKNNNTEHTEGGHASDLIRKNCFFSSEEFKFNNFAIDNLDFWQQSALNFKVFKSIKLQSSSSSSPVRNSDSFLANLLILFVKILILFYHSECVRRVGFKQKDRMTYRSSSYALRLQVARSEVGWQREYLNGDWEERIHREWNESSSRCWNIGNIGYFQANQLFWLFWPLWHFSW